MLKFRFDRRIIFRRGASYLRIFASENLAYDFGRNTSTLSEFTGYADLGFRVRVVVKFRQKIPEIMTNQSVSGNFDI